MYARRCFPSSLSSNTQQGSWSVNKGSKIALLTISEITCIDKYVLNVGTDAAEVLLSWQPDFSLFLSLFKIKKVFWITGRFSDMGKFGRENSVFADPGPEAMESRLQGEHG